MAQQKTERVQTNNLRGAHVTSEKTALLAALGRLVDQLKTDGSVIDPDTVAIQNHK